MNVLVVLTDKANTKEGWDCQKTEAIDKVVQCKWAWIVLTNVSSFRVQYTRTKYLQNVDLFWYKQKNIYSHI